MNDRYYKKYIEKLIQDDPADITITRLIEEDDGYGGVWTEEVNIDATVRFYDKNGRREVITDYGRTFTGVSITKMLAMNDVDIVKDDKFKVNGVEFKVFHINEYRGICKQIELEVIQ